MQSVVSGEMIKQVVESVFTTMMSLEVSSSDVRWRSMRDRVTAVVHLTGNWNGAILLDCNPQQACQFAGRILSMEVPKKVDNDVRDVLGELANMIGGNLKCGMGMGVLLSQPSVMEGREWELPVFGSEIVEALAFQCAAGHFWVTVLRRLE